MQQVSKWKRMLREQTANILSGLRILLALALLLCPVLSLSFSILYLIAGISDMIDGPAARKLHTVSAFGARLDTAADFVLVAVCLYRLLPVLEIPKWLLVWALVIALIRGINLVSGLVMRKKLVVLHTVLNKLTGFLLFLLPLSLHVLDLRLSGAVVCTVATLAAIQEGHFIRTGKE